MLPAVCLLLVLAFATLAASTSDTQSSSGYREVDPWDVVTDYDVSENRSEHLHVIDKTLRQAQKNVKYFQDSLEPWEKEEEVDEERGDDHLMGFDYDAWNRTYIRPPKGFGDKQTTDLMKKTMIPEFDITKIKLKTDKKDNSTAIISVVIKQGPVNKIEGYSSKRLFVQINAPSYKGALENELARYLSQTLGISRTVIKVQQGAGWNIRKVKVPKKAIQEQVYLRKLIREFDLERVTDGYDA